MKEAGLKVAWVTQGEGHLGKQLPGRPGQWAGPQTLVSVYGVEEKSTCSDLSQLLFHKASAAPLLGTGSRAAGCLKFLKETSQGLDPATQGNPTVSKPEGTLGKRQDLGEVGERNKA